MLWLLILCITCRNAASKTFYILSTPDDSCPAPNLGQCFTLQQYADSRQIGYHSDITLKLQPGNHSLNSTLTLTILNNVANFSMTSTNGSVTCSGENKDTGGRFSLSGVQNVYIGQLTFINCYNNKIEDMQTFITEDSTFLGGNFRAWEFLDIANIIVRRCLFSRILSTVLFFRDRESNITVDNCRFISNGADVDGKGGKFGGAIYSHGTLTIRDSNFVDNQAFVSGGAVCIQYSPIFVTGCNYTHNKANQTGGAICALGAGGLIINSTFIENAVTNAADKGQGGALYYRTLSSDSPLELHYCTFSGNTAVHAGGAVYSWSKFNVTIVSSTFRNNSATSAGALLFYKNKNNPAPVILSLVSCAFVDNTAIVRSRNRIGLPSVQEIGSGGALIVQGGLRCFRSNFTGNSAEMHAGVVYMSNTENYIYSEGCIFTNNSARGGIGGVYHCRLKHTAVHILDNSFQGNTALHCGVVYATIFSSGDVNNITIESSLFTNNSAVGSSGNGGVACISYGSVLINCSGFSHNTAAQNGGVIYTYQSDITIVSSSFINNAAVKDGGVMHANHVSNKILKTKMSYNYVGNDGGAAFILNNSQGDIGDSVFSHNNAENGGGAFYVNSSELEISATNFFGNRVGSTIGTNILFCSGNRIVFNSTANERDSCMSYSEDIQHFPEPDGLECSAYVFSEAEYTIIYTASTTASQVSASTPIPAGQ